MCPGCGEEENFLFQFKDCHKKEISSSSLMFLSPKEEVDMDEPLSHYPKNNKVNC